MAQIKDTVSVQLYGDKDFEMEIIKALESAGVAVKTTQEKPYTTKKGDEGYYIGLKLTYSNDTSND
jgi:ACT domain-containing protein